jgi:DNA repair exonuclease SbcCD nuclease subunit
MPGSVELPIDQKADGGNAGWVMKFVLLSDVHLITENPVGRMDDLVSVQFDKLKFVFDTAKGMGATILQAGDLFDKPRSWLLLPKMIEFLSGYKIPVLCVFGQHDQYFYSEGIRERTNLGVLAKAGLIILLDPDRPYRVPGQDVSIYGANFSQKLGKIQRSGLTIGVIHAPISDAPLYPDHAYSAASDFLENTLGYDLILCGDIHRSFYFEKDGRQIVNVGPMTRQEATEYNFAHEPGVAVFDTDTKNLEWIDIPCEPAIKVLSRDHIERKKESEELLSGFVRELGEGSEVDGVSFIENLWAFTKKNKIDKNVIDVLAEVING